MSNEGSSHMRIAACSEEFDAKSAECGPRGRYGKRETRPGNHQMAARAIQGDPRALMYRRVLTALGTLPTQVLRDKIPVHQIPPRCDILGAGITVIDIVRMLPDIAGHQWGFARAQRAASIRRGFNADITGRIFHQPGPARAKLSSRSGTKRVLEGLKIAPALIDRSRHLTGRFPSTTGRHRVPVKGVVPDLGRVVEKTAFRGSADQLFERLIGFRFALCEVIQVRDIGLVMPAVVKIERFSRNMGLQGIFSIREWW